MPSRQRTTNCLRYPLLYADSLTISAGGDINLQSSTDIQCFNYTLKTAFNCTPSIAICKHIMIQPWTTFLAQLATTFSFRSRQSAQIATVLSPSSLEHNGPILDGPKLVFHFWLKLHPNLELDSIKLTPLRSLPASQVKKLSLSSPLLTRVLKPLKL